MGILSRLAKPVRALVDKTKPVGKNIREAAADASKHGTRDRARLAPEVLDEGSPQPLKDMLDEEEYDRLLDEDGAPIRDPEVMDPDDVEVLPREEPDVPIQARDVEPASIEDTEDLVRAAGGGKAMPIDKEVANTNYTRWDTEADMESMWETSARQIDAEVDEGFAGKRMSHDEMIDKAKKAGYNDDVLGWILRQVESGEVDIETLPGQVIIARETAVQLGEELFEQARKIAYAADTGSAIDEVDLLMFQKNMTKFRMVQQAVGKYTRLAGQLLGSFNYIAKNQGHVKRMQMQELLDDLGGGESIITKAKNIADLEDVAALSEEVTQTFWERGAQVLEAVRYNNMLSGVATSLRNIIGNLSHGTYIMAHTGLSAVGGSARMALRGQRGLPTNSKVVAVSDYVNGVRAMGNSTMESLYMGVKTWADPSTQIGNKGKLEASRMVTIRGGRLDEMAARFGIMGRGFIKMIDLLGLTLGTRNLAGGDDFFKNAWWRFDTHMNATKLARMEGLTGKEADDFIAKELTRPRMKEELFESGITSAQIGTHTQQPVWGSFGRNFMQLRNTPGGLGYTMRLAVPFARVLMNIMTWNAKTATLPLHPLISSELRASVRAGDQAGMDYLGKLGLYTTLFGYVGYQTAENNITGTGRYVDNRTLRLWRDSGWQPMSIRRRNADGTHTYISFAQVQPFGSLIAWMADMTDVINYYGDGKGGMDDFVDGAAASLKILAAGPFEAPFARGMYDWMGILFEERSASKVAKNIVSQFTGPPAWLRDAEKMSNPDRSQTYGVDLMDELANQFQSKVPMWSASMPPRLTVFGEPADPATSPWSIFPVTRSKYDDVFMGLNNNEVFISLHRDPIVRVGGQDVDLYNMEHPRGVGWALHEYAKLQGNELRNELLAVTRSSDYHKAPEGPAGSGIGETAQAYNPTKGDFLTRAVTKAKRTAKAKFAERNRGSAFERAWKGAKIKQPDKRPPAMHAGMRERRQPVAAEF